MGGGAGGLRGVEEGVFVGGWDFYIEFYAEYREAISEMKLVKKVYVSCYPAIENYSMNILLFW